MLVPVNQSLIDEMRDLNFLPDEPVEVKRTKSKKGKRRIRRRSFVQESDASVEDGDESQAAVELNQLRANSDSVGELLEIVDDLAGYGDDESSPHNSD